MPLPQHIAVVSLTRDISTRSLLLATAALQKQVTRDFSPIWGLAATVDAFDDLRSVPSDYHPVVLFGDPRELTAGLESALGAQPTERLLAELQTERIAGVHLNALTRQPFALVSAREAWTVVLSHEVLELLADPSGNHLVAGPHPTRPAQRVKYLIEVCDPCLARWYPVNGVPCADFYTPRYFDPVRVDGTRYSFTGSIEYPRQILEGGYLTFMEPRDSALYQLRAGEPEPVLLAGLTELARSTAPLRTVVDSDPRTPQVSLSSLRPADGAAAAESPYLGVREASEGAGLRAAEALFSLATGAG